MSSERFSGIELIVLNYPGDHDSDVQSTIRKTLGDINWSTAEVAPPVNVRPVSCSSTPRDVLMFVDSLNRAAPSVVLLCHPSVKATPLIWACLEKQQRSDFAIRQRSVIRLCKNATVFRHRVAETLREKKIDIESKLRRVLLDTHGKDIVDGWKTQFAKAGRKEYADFIISAMNLIERKHLSQALDQMPLEPFSTCVLLGNGSDLAIRRKLEGKPGWPPVRSLQEFLRQNRADQIALVVDAIHGGGQVSSCLEGLAEAIQRQGVRIRIFPLHATRKGISRLVNALGGMNLAAVVSVDCSHSIVLENEERNSLDEPVSVPELVLRMRCLGYGESIVSEVRSFAMKIGALLEQRLCGDEFPDFSKGLGLHFMGLTTLIDGYPGLSVLPIIRTSCPQGSTISFDGRKIEWQALVAHQNDQVEQVASDA